MADGSVQNYHNDALVAEGRVGSIPFRHDFKLAGYVPLPLGFEVSASLMSYAGTGSASLFSFKPWLDANWVVPVSVFPGGRRTQSVTVKLREPGTKFLERWNQLDLSFKKVVRIGSRRLEGQAAIFNLNNSSVVLTELQAFGPSLGRPITIMQGRLLRLSVSANF